MNRPTVDSDRSSGRYRLVETILLGALLVALGIAWGAAGLMVVAAVVTLVMSAPSLLVFVSVWLAVILVARAVLGAIATGRHGPTPRAR